CPENIRNDTPTDSQGKSRERDCWQRNTRKSESAGSREPATSSLPQLRLHEYQTLRVALRLTDKATAHTERLADTQQNPPRC
ncbi:hypothetical protein KUCAC02_032691, partial [Chaenocephalus aceratus]